MAPLATTASAQEFTHSVHNAQAGLFSIAAKNRRMASALAGRADTFPSAFIEALALIERAGGGRALLVIADEPLPALFEAFQDEPRAAYGLALVIEREDSAAPSAPASQPPWPRV